MPYKKKKPGRAYLRRLEERAAASLLTLVTILGGVGCIARTEERSCQEDATYKFFKMLYESIQVEELSREEREEVRKLGLSEVLPVFKEQVFKDFLREKVPYVNLENPSERDILFLNTRKSEISLYLHHQSIDPENLTEEQKKLLRDFNKRKITEQDREFMRKFPWVNAENPTERDKVFIMEIAEAFYIGSVVPPNN